VNLLSRALELFPPDSLARPRLLVDLALALDLSGRSNDAALRLEQASASARSAGDRNTESLVKLRTIALSARLSTTSFQALLGELHSMLPELEEAGDHRTL